MASTYLSRTLGTPTDENRWTYSFWTKISKISDYSWFLQTGTNASNNVDAIHIDVTNSILRAYGYPGSQVWELITNAKYRDPSAWYHIVIAYNSDEATSSDRAKMWVNGVQQTSFSTEIYPSLGANSGHINKSGSVYYIGSNINTNVFSEMLMTHLHFIDGTAYDASAFGEYSATSGVWKPKTAPSVTYGANGFFLKFANAGSLGTDSSGNSNNFTVNGTGTQTLDTPSNVFCNINALNPQIAGMTIVNGNLSLTANATNAWRTTYGTLAVNSGKWYWEQKVTAASGSAHYIGITDQDENRSSDTNDFENANVSAYCYRGDGGKVTSVSGSTVLTPGAGDSFTTNDIIGIAMDLDNQKIYFSKNGTWQASGDPTSGATGTGSFFNITAGILYTPATAVYNTGSGYQYNFGNGYFGTTAVSTPESDGDGFGKFEYAVPTGYYSLCTKNIITYG